ncbi:NAD-dependent dihydropyrimidine dehydrogenase subunit PreA [bacterium]|nr:NAD-dependent dihydropyrimidine dehydrogenase subunit PreA [bacterium]
MRDYKDKLSFDFLGVHFDNPYILAATPSTDDEEMLFEALKAGWAGAIIKTTSVKENEVDLKYPMMYGLKHKGSNLMTLGNVDLISENPVNKVEAMIKVLKEEFPNKVIIASIMGKDKKEWQTLTRKLVKAGADMIECSFSCPQGNIGEDPGRMLSQSAKATEIATGWVKGAAKNTPVLIKITPQVTDIAEIAKAVKAGGGDAVIVSNSVLGLIGIDIEKGRPLPTINGYGGFAGITGVSVKPITLKNIVQVAKNVKIPIFGVGGVSDHKDAIELMMAGASVVQVGTEAMHYGFRIIDGMLEGMYNFIERKKFKDITRIVGKALPYIVQHDNVPYKEGDEPVANIDQDKCIQCKICYIACQQGGHRAIYTEGDEVLVDEEKCFGCGFCPSVCPVDAITLKKRKKPKIKKESEPLSTLESIPKTEKVVKSQHSTVVPAKKEPAKPIKKNIPNPVKKTAPVKEVPKKKIVEKPKQTEKKAVEKKIVKAKTPIKKIPAKPVKKKETVKPAPKKKIVEKPKPTKKKAVEKKIVKAKTAVKKTVVKSIKKPTHPPVKKAIPKSVKKTVSKSEKKTIPAKKILKKKAVKKSKPVEKKIVKKTSKPKVESKNKKTNSKKKN